MAITISKIISKAISAPTMKEAVQFENQSCKKTGEAHENEKRRVFPSFLRSSVYFEDLDRKMQYFLS